MRALVPAAGSGGQTLWESRRRCSQRGQCGSYEQKGGEPQCASVNLVHGDLLFLEIRSTQVSRSSRKRCRLQRMLRTRESGNNCLAKDLYVSRLHLGLCRWRAQEQRKRTGYTHQYDAPSSAARLRARDCMTFTLTTVNPTRRAVSRSESLSRKRQANTSR